MADKQNTVQVDENEADIRGLMDELRNAEQKFRRLVEKRNELNDQAREARDERDGLNERKKDLVAQMRKLQEERDGFNAEARKHKEKRNEFQRQAKALIEQKRAMRRDATGAPGPAGAGKPSGMGRLRDIEGELRRLERRQETTAMKVAEENELIKKMGELRRELASVKETYSEEAKALSEIKGVDEKIDALFKMADDEHKHVVELSEKGQACHDQIGPVLEQLRFLDAESDKKHEGYIALRKQADEYHNQATDLRQQVEKLRDKRAEVFKERRAVVGEHQQGVKQSLFDEVKLEEKAEDDLKSLLASGKLTLG